VVGSCAHDNGKSGAIKRAKILEDLKNYYSQQELPHTYEGWNFNSGNYLFTTDTK